ncbi:MAG TPA: sodium:solute symporter family protein [Vicinamibacterales bacterium]|nr:sodium:solute symporter family protein [Vicinamibacterales bacterium]
MAGLGSIGLVVFSIYMVLLVAIGVIAARYQRTSEDFWVAGRRFGIGLMVVAEMASVLHGGSVQGGVALAARFGGVAILPYISFALASLIIVRFFAMKLRMMSGFTLPDYMGARFESNFLRGYSALIVFVSSVLYMIAQIRVMGFLLQQLLGIPFVLGMAVGAGIFILFVTLGGLLAVVWTDILLFVLMWTGLLAILPAVKAAAGGLTHVMIAADAAAPGWTSVRGTAWSWTYLVSWWMVWVVGYATRVTMITKVFAAKDTRVARISLPITDALFMIFLLYGNLYLGAAARVLVWGQVAKTPDQAFPALVTYVSNLAGTPWLGAIAITGVVSAAIATSDSLLLMSGAAIAHDLLRKCYYEPRGIFNTERFYLRISRLSVVVVGVVSFLAALRTPELILNIVSYAVALVGVAFFFPMLFGLNSPYLSRKAAAWSSVAGSVVGLIWTVPHLAYAAWARANAPWILDIHPVVPGLVAAIVPIAIFWSRRLEMSPKAMQLFFPERTGSAPSLP